MAQTRNGAPNFGGRKTDTSKTMMGLTKPFVTIAGVPLSGKSIILLLGGLFLIGKSTHEIRSKLEGTVKEREIKAIPPSLGSSHR
jgi:predicted tellurium resistance membrane protein TerC